MTPDGLPAPPSGSSTPFTAGIMTPQPGQPGTSPSKVTDYFSAALGPKGRMKEKKYLGGSKALEALSKLIISCESFFHPTNSGKWTNDVRRAILSTSTTLTLGSPAHGVREVYRL
jgi:proteasome activator subunit 4